MRHVVSIIAALLAAALLSASPGRAEMPPTGQVSAALAPTPPLATQTLSSVGRIQWDVTDMATLGMKVDGTAVMTVRYISTNGDPTTATTSNRPWKAGASLGTNTVAYSGVVNTEYRLVGGRRYLVVECTSYTSGSLTFKPYASPHGGISYIGGGVQDVSEEAAIQGITFNASTSFLSVPAGSYGQLVIENPVGSNKLYLVKVRRFSSSITGAFLGISNPTAATFDNQTGAAAPVTLTPSNLRTGTAAVPSPTSTAIVKYNVSATRVDSNPSNTNPAGDLLAANMPYTLGKEYVRIIPPGSRFAHAIGGASAGLGANAQVSLYALWEERDLY